jgi:S1-C subfamily serine protease
MDLKETHEKMIYPVCRVRTQRAGGSGTVIYSKEDPHESGEYLTYILTNHHVVEGAIKHKKKWDSVLLKDSKKEFLKPVEVELFDYIRTSTVNSSNTHKAQIMCYSEDHDLALLKLDSPKKVEYAATIIKKEDIKRKLFLTTKILLVGCSLLHDPIPSYGKITGLKEEIDNKNYVLNDADSIFGNSGGAVFLEETGELIGVPSRVTTLQLGYGLDVLTFMNFFASPERIYEFLDEQLFKFIYNEKASGYAETLELRKKEAKKALYGKDEDMDDDDDDDPDGEEADPDAGEEPE